MKVQFLGQLTKVESRVDRTLKLTLGTQELGSDAGTLMNLAGEMIQVLLASSDSSVSPEEVDAPDVKAGEEYGGKTPAQLQRAILYRIWEARSKPTLTFEEYYRLRMSKNEEVLKKELDDLTT